MKLTLLHILSFGGLNNCNIRTDDGVNVLFGPDESGKSSAAMFIKFIFCGLSSEASDGEPSERDRYVSRLTGQAAGYLLLETDDGTEYRVERAILTSDDAPARERVRIINRATGEAVTDRNPCEYFFGVSPDVFLSTCFAGPIEEDAASAEFFRVSTSLDHIQKRIRELEENQQTYTGIFNALDKILLRRRIEATAQIEQNIDALRSTVDELDASALGTKFAEAVGEAERDIRRYTDACAACSLASDGDSAFPDTDELDLTEETDPIPASADLLPPETAHRLENNAHTQFTCALVFFLAGLFGFAASLLMYWFNTDTYIVPLVMTLAFVTSGVVFILLHTRSVNELTRLLNDWNTASVEELEQLFTDPEADEADSGETDVPEDAPDTIGEPDAPDFRTLREAFESAAVKVSELCRTADIEESDDLTETLNALRAAADDIRRDREAMTAKISSLTEKLEVLNEQLADADRLQAEYEYKEILKTPHGQTADRLTADEVKTLMKERDFTAAALRSAEQRRSDLEAQLANLGTPAPIPEALEHLLALAEETFRKETPILLYDESFSRIDVSRIGGIVTRLSDGQHLILTSRREEAEAAEMAGAGILQMK